MLNGEQLSGCACIVCGRGDRPLVPIMVETKWATMVFRCQVCSCDKKTARKLIAEAERQE